MHLFTCPLTRHRAIRVGLGTAALALMVGAAGCTGTGPGTAPESAATAATWDTATVTPRGGVLTLADGSVPSAREIDLSTARTARAGIDYDVVRTSVPRSAAWTLGGLALAPSGELFMSVDPVGQFDGGAWLLKPSGVGMTNGETFTRWPSSDDVLSDPHPRQVYSASVEDSTAAWAETPSAGAGVSSWRIFAGSGGAPRLIARSEDAVAGELPIADGGTTVLLAGGRVYWPTTVPSAGGDGDGFGVQVMSRAADGSDRAVLEVAGGSQPAVAGGRVYAARSTREDPSLPGGSFSIRRATGAGTSGTVLDLAGGADASVHSLVAAGDRLAFVIGTQQEAGGQIVVLDVSTSTLTAVPLLSSGRETTLALCGNRLAWTSANGSTGVPDNGSIGVLDLTTGELARIIEPDNFAGVRCAGDLLSWSTIGVGPDARGVPTVVRWTAR